MHVPQTEIILRHANAELARVTLPPGEYVIGRSAEAPIRADTQLLSRQHARLTINYDHLLLEDLGSANGTFVNEQPVTEATRLFPNQSIRLGPDITLEVRRQRAPTEPGVSLAPAQAAIARHLPDELLAEKRYAIGSVIAQGGMGAILDAQQAAMKRRVAMKVMLETGDEGDVLRFIDEAQITGQLDHPNIVPIYELGVDEQGQVFYTMKMVRGITLKKVLQLLAEGTEATVKKYPLPTLLTVFQKACDAVAFAHSKGVIHRDLKPENIMLGDFGSVLVMDWGLAKVLSGRDGSASHPGGFGATALPQGNAPGTDGAVPSSPAGSVLSARASEPQYGSTLAGTILGTPAYMSPEQARGEVEKLDARSDIYALGVILFEILHLRSAVRGPNALLIVDKVQRAEIEWTAPEGVVLTSKPKALPASLLAVCRQALALNPAARYTRVEDLQADLLAYQTGFATSAEKAGLAKQLLLALKRHKVAAIGAAAVLVVGGVLGTKAVVEGRRANRTLASMRDSAPILYAETRRLIDNQKFDEALGKILFACEIEPQNADYRLLLAQLLEARLDLASAAEEFRRVLALGPNESARTNLALCERLLRDYPPPAVLDPPALGALEQQLEKEGRLTQAAPLAIKLGDSKKAVESILQAKLVLWRKIPGWDKIPEGERVSWEKDGTLNLGFLGVQIEDLTTLQGLPISRLILRDTPVSDLRPLAGLRLRLIDLNGAKKLRDLSPLKGLPLESVEIAFLIPPTDLSPLAGMKLKFLGIGHGSFPDLSPLRGMPLLKGYIDDPNVTNLDVLSGAPLTEFGLVGCSALTDISALRHMPLRSLQLHSCPKLRDFTPLLDCPALESVSVPAGVKEVEVLRQHPGLKYIKDGRDIYEPFRADDFWYDHDAQSDPQIRERFAQIKATMPGAVISLLKTWGLRVDLSRRQISDLQPLRPFPIDYLILDRTSLTDLSPLRGMRLRMLTFNETAITDVSPLLEMPVLEAAMVSKSATNLEVLRHHPTLKYLGWEDADWDSDALRPKVPVVEFWARYDALKAGGK